jgi:hypothetical protein
MKKIVSTLLFIFTLFVSLNATSQNLERFPRLRERIIQAKLREIKLSLKLDPATFEQFRPIYLKYEQEITGIDFRKLAGLMRVDADSLSVDEADQLLVHQLESAKKLVNIREKYYKEFRRLISPQQIIKLYQTEAELRKKVVQEIKRRKMNR